MFRNPSASAIRELLAEVRSIAVVGFSPKPERPSHRIGRALQGFGYRVIPVHPALVEGLGEKAYRRLCDLPEAPDLVDVFRAPEHVDAVVDDCLAIGVRRLWLQDGVLNEAAAERAAAAGITVIMDRCIWRDYRALMDER
ncbi:MAG: CoA-binding protein [Rhodocyclaceae bacterium]|nr:CoA-binding protein [Rhodocyclaceae bacterium]